MSTVIQVLEKMGSDANLQSEQAIEQLLAASEVNAEQTEAIMTKDVISLERQLDVCPDIVCLLVPAEDDEKEDKEKEDEDDNDIKSVVNG